MRHLLLLSPQTTEWTPAFRAALASLDLAADLVCGVDEATVAWASGRFPALILAGEPADVDGRRLDALLAHAGAKSLAVVPHGAVTHSPWLRLVADVAFWPTASRELEFRVRRVAVAGEPAPRVDEALARMLAAAEIVGSAYAFVTALELLPRIVRCDAPVLITGETGTGKDVVARAIHYLGARGGGPFVPVNCAALPESLFENELFGHARGAYTDAAAAQSGLAAQADRGTLFLDEVDTLSPRSQAALLRFLQDGQFRPLGAGAARTSDARVLAASNREIEQAVAAGTFREDLFYRLNVLRVSLPPLRHRRADIAPLARHMVARLSRRYAEPKRLTAPAEAWLAAQEWRGNVRELENWVHRRFLLSPGDTLLPEAAGAAEGAGRDGAPRPAAAETPEFRAAKREAIVAFEHRYLLSLIEGARGNVTLASRRSGTERRALRRLLEKHGIDPLTFRSRDAGRGAPHR